MSKTETTYELTKPENEKLMKEAEGANRKNVENEME